MLESLEKMNIKRMSIESPEKVRVPFRPDQEMTTEDWGKIELYKTVLDPNDLGTIKDLQPEFEPPAANLEVIRKKIEEKMGNSSLTATEHVDIMFDIQSLWKVDNSHEFYLLRFRLADRLRDLAKGLMHYKTTNRAQIFLMGVATAEKLNFSVPVIFTEDDRKKVEETLQSNRAGQIWKNFFLGAEALKHFQPDYQVDLTEDESSSIKKKLESYMKDGQVSDYLALMSAIKRVAPSITSAIETTIPAKPDERNF